jgi:TRAP-type mannitol/chloroaromatic compound transport system permease large subunit
MMAASTGIVGATVVTMGLISLPTMLGKGYHPNVATGTICASGTLGQIIPPSIVLVMLADVLSNAYQQAQLQMGNYSPKTVSVGELFAGALVPGLILVGAYLLYLLILAWLKPSTMPADKDDGQERVSLGRLLALAAKNLTMETLKDVVYRTASISSMVFMILIGASLFSLVFRGFGGDELIAEVLTGLPGGVVTAMILVMLVMFLLGFVLDFIEITFVVVPIVGPVLMAMGLNPIWLGIMMALNLQTSFLTPPFGFSLFYLRGVCPESVPTSAIYRGVIPFILIQLFVLGLLALFPQLITWLPGVIYPG